MSLPSATLDRRSVRTLAGAIAIATIVGCSISLTIALLSVRLDQGGFSAVAIGINTASGGVATLVGAPFIPWAARRFGVARLLLASLCLGGIGLIGFTMTADYTAWLVLRFALGLAVTAEFVLSEFWITTAAPEGRRGLAIGIYAAALAAGFAAGPLVLSLIGTSGNLPFYFGAALFFIAAIPLAFNAGDAPNITLRSGKTLLTFLREAPGATLAGLLHGAIEVACLSLLPIYALRAGLSVTDGALFASIFILGNSALQLPLGLLADRIDKRLLLLVLASVGFFGALFLGMLGIRLLFVFEVTLLLWGGIVGALYPVGLGQLGADYEGSDLASANSAFVMTYAGGMLIGPPLIGIGLDMAPPSGLFWAIAALIGLYLAVAAPDVLRRRQRASRVS